MRLIDCDKLKTTLGFSDNCKDCKIGKNCIHETFSAYGICTLLADSLTVTPKPEWISVKDRMPPEHDSIFAKFYGTKQWNPSMFQRSSDDVRVAVLFEDGTRMVSHDHTFDGKWRCEMEKCAYPKRTVTHWMENPKLPKEET